MTLPPRIASLALLTLIYSAVSGRLVSAVPTPATTAPPSLLLTALTSATPQPTPLVVNFTRLSLTPPPVIKDVAFPRTEVHVLEKCCPYATHYAVGRYPSTLEEEQDWVPALTFHAFKYNAALTNCWHIVNAATDKDPLASPGSQLWDTIPEGSQPADPASAFCLPTEPCLQQTFFYVSAVDGRASFITEPLTNVSQRFFDEFSLPGWTTTTPSPSSVKPTPAPTSRAASPQRQADFQPIYPLAYYYWRPRLPTNVIIDIRLRVSESSATINCPSGYEMARGNLNHNFALDPYSAFCIKSAPKRLLNPFLSVPSEYTEGKYVTGIKIKPRNSELVNKRRKNETEDLVDCPPPWELMLTTLDTTTWDQREVAERQAKVLRKLNHTFEAFNLTSEFSVFTGYGEWLSFCTLKDDLYLPDAQLRNLSEFVERIFVDQSQIARKNRLTTVYNSETPHPLKVVPQGRLKSVKADTSQV